MSTPRAHRLIGWEPGISPPPSPQAKAFSAIGTTGPWGPFVSFLSPASAATNASLGTQGGLFRNNWYAICLRGFLARSPHSKTLTSNAPSSAPNPHSPPRALVFVPIFLFLAQICGCERWQIPQEGLFASWKFCDLGLCVFLKSMDPMESFTTANLCQKIVFRDQKNDMFAKESSVRLVSARQMGNARFRRAGRRTGFRASGIHSCAGHPLKRQTPITV